MKKTHLKKDSQKNQKKDDAKIGKTTKFPHTCGFRGLNFSYEIIFFLISNPISHLLIQIFSTDSFAQVCFHTESICLRNLFNKKAGNLHKHRLTSNN